MEITSATKKCQACGKDMPEKKFTCPHCNAAQKAGAWTFSQMRSQVAPEAASHAVMPNLSSAFRGGPFAVGVIGFSRKVKVLLPVSPVEKAGPIELEIHSGTNGQDALEKAEEMLFGNPTQLHARSVIIMMSDGDINCCNGLPNLFSSSEVAKKKAIETATRIKKERRVRIATILFDKGSFDENTLREIASDNLFMRAGQGQLLRALLSMSEIATRTAETVDGANVIPGTAIVFCLDCSPSMEEEGKKEEAEHAFAKLIEELLSWR